MCLCVMSLSVATAMADGEKKLVTNTDVVTMIKAGLPESTIIMAIKQGPAGFDTSTTALIELKKQGATSGMLEAMMQPAVSLTPIKTSTGNPFLDAYSEQMSGGVETGVILQDGANKVQMKYVMMESQAKMNFAPFAPSKVYSKLDGQRSACRVSSGKPHFEFSMARDVQPTTRVTLVLLAVREQSRIIQSMSAGMGGVTSGFPKERIIALEITEIKSNGNESALGQTRYVATPTGTLVPGEYALIFDKGQAFDFGVDTP